MTIDSLVPPQTLVGRRGRLDYADGRSTACEFEVRQAEDSGVVIVCKHQQPDWVWHESLGDLTAPHRFSGQTDAGPRIDVEGEFLQTSFSAGLTDPPGGVAVTYVVNGPGITVLGARDQGGPISAHFHLVNFLFIGNVSTHRSLPGGGDAWSLDTLALELAGRTVSIRLRPDHEEVGRQLEVTRGIAVTCTLTVGLESVETAGEAEVLVDHLCALLTLASGCKVTWVANEVRSGPAMVAGTMRAVPRRHFSKWALIDTRDPQLLKAFVESAYPTFVKLEKDYELRRVVDARVDALSAGFLETKASIAVVLGEFLCKRFGHLHGFGASSLEAYLRYFIRTQCLRIRGKDVRKFVKTRNALIHEMRFRTVRQAAEHRAAVHLIDRIVLGVLGYKGPFIDCRAWKVTTEPENQNDRDAS